MREDLRCCGTGTCIINTDGECWCGQRWDGEKMCFQHAMAQDVQASNQSSVDAPQAINKPD